MKKLISIVLAILIMAIPALSLADSTTSAGTINVTGKASVMAEPDRATVTFGVELTRDDAQTAQTDVNSIINAAVEAIKALNIDEKAIQTEMLNINREYDYSGDTPEARGFCASTQLSVALDDIALTGAVIDAGLNAGLNTVSGVTFSSSKQAEYYDQALAAAIENARHKGDIMAQAAGGSISSISSITEEYSSGIYVMRSEATYDMGATSAKGATNVSAGEIEISAQVTAVFTLG